MARAAQRERARRSGAMSDLPSLVAVHLLLLTQRPQVCGCASSLDASTAQGRARIAAAAASLLVAAASASDFENWNPNERDPDGKTDAQLLVERAEFVREQIDDGGHLDADHDHKRGHVDIVAPDEPALRAAIERANAMPSRSRCASSHGEHGVRADGAAAA